MMQFPIELNCDGGKKWFRKRLKVHFDKITNMYSIYHREKSIKPNPIECWKVDRRGKTKSKLSNRQKISNFVHIGNSREAAAVACKSNIFYRLWNVWYFVCAYFFDCKYPNQRWAARCCLIYFHPWISRARGNLHTQRMCMYLYLDIFELKLWIICARRETEQQVVDSACVCELA